MKNQQPNPTPHQFAGPFSWGCSICGYNYRAAHHKEPDGGWPSGATTGEPASAPAVAETGDRSVRTDVAPAPTAIAASGEALIGVPIDLGVEKVAALFDLPMDEIEPDGTWVSPAVRLQRQWERALLHGEAIPGPPEPLAGAVLIPERWSFDAPTIAANFTEHVRQQLPFYDLATQAVVDLARLHLPPGGTVVDLGASNGNIARALTATLDERHARMLSIDESENMAATFDGPGEFVVADLVNEYVADPADVVISFLTLAFLPVGEREQVLDNWVSALVPGGCFILVERLALGSEALAARYLIQAAKSRAGASDDDVTNKEASIAGVLRPIPFDLIARVAARQGLTAWPFFAYGDFHGYIIEVPE